MLTKHPGSASDTVTPARIPIGPSFLDLILSKFCKILNMAKDICVRANCWPMQILGPPLNGVYSQATLCVTIRISIAALTRYLGLGF